MSDVNLNNETETQHEDDILKSLEALIDEAMEEAQKLHKSNELEAANLHVEGNLQGDPNGEMPKESKHSGDGIVAESVKAEKKLGKKDEKPSDEEDEDDESDSEEEKDEKKPEEKVEKTENVNDEVISLLKSMQETLAALVSKNVETKKEEKITKSEDDSDLDDLRTSYDSRFEHLTDTLNELTKSMSDLQESVEEIATAPAGRRKSAGSGPAPLYKSEEEDAEPTLNKSQVLDKLLALQKTDSGANYNALIQRVVAEKDPAVIAELVNGVL